MYGNCDKMYYLCCIIHSCCIFIYALIFLLVFILILFLSFYPYHTLSNILLYSSVELFSCKLVNLLLVTLKPQSNEPLYSNTVIGTFGTVMRGLGGLRPRPVPSSLYQM